VLLHRLFTGSIELSLELLDKEIDNLFAGHQPALHNSHPTVRAQPVEKGKGTRSHPGPQPSKLHELIDVEARGNRSIVKSLLRRVARRVLKRRPAAGTPVRVRFGHSEGAGRVGDTLLATARSLAVDLDSFCGGRCSCGTCRVLVVAGPLSDISLNEEVVLGAAAVDKGYRLACQAALLGDVSVEVPEFLGIDV